MTESKGRALIVEDEAVVALDITKILEELGYEVVGTARSGPDALTLALETAPDVALLDIRLHGDMDGVQVALSLREQLRIPSIFITAHTDPETVQRGKAAEPLGYVVKPFTERELYCVMEVALHTQRTERMIRQRTEELERWKAEVERIGTLVDDDNIDGAFVAVDTFTSLTIGNIIEALTNIKHLVDRLAARHGDPDACHLIRCPRRLQMEEAVRDAVQTLEKTKGTFKSKELGALRVRLEQTLASGRPTRA